MSRYRLALAHYRLLFPTLASLGTGTIPDTWYTEYNRVLAAGAFDQVMITSGSFEGGQGAGQRNFDQKTLLSALHHRRHELDPTYDYTAARPMGITVLLGDGGISSGTVLTTP